MRPKDAAFHLFSFLLSIFEGGTGGWGITQLEKEKMNIT